MKLSIITVCLNNKAGLINTIKSVFSQTSKDYELIVIDGGSTDGSKEILEQYSSNIYYWVSEPDKGIYNAMNKGICAANGEYCIFMNAGDIFFDNNVVSRFINEKPAEDILCGNIIFNLNGKPLKMIEAPREANVMFFMSASLPHQSSFIRTDLLKKNPYDESYKIVSDFIFFFQAIILKSATYKKLDFFVSNSDFSGISNNQLSMLWSEKEKYFETILPPVLYKELISYAWDYKDFWGLPKQSFIYSLFTNTRKIFFNLFKLCIRIRNKIKIKKSTVN